VKVAGRDLPVEHLIQTKDTRTAYFLWMTMGVLGGHLFYTDRLVHGVLAAVTGNFFGVGWFFDFFLIPTYVYAVNKQVPPEAARPDGSCGRICCRLPLAGIVMLMALLTFIFRFPSFLHGAGVVDLEQSLAGTAGNPYVILEVERDAPPHELKKAYQSRLQELEASKDCKDRNKVCKAMKKDLKQALDFILYGDSPRLEGHREKQKETRKARYGDAQSQSDKEWADWGDWLRAEWHAVGEEVKEGGKQFAKNVEKDYFS